MDDHKPHPKKMYVPWFPTEEVETSFSSYIHQNLHHEIGEDVGFPDSSWSYMNAETPFEKKQNSDATLHFNILDEFYKNKDVDASKIEILVYNGIVHLSGSVRTEKERRRAKEIVCQLEHVWSVENLIEVKDDLVTQRGFDRPTFL